MASVVDLEGYSYRRLGVLISVQSNGKMIGMVSGGCVEKEVPRQAQSVFETQQSKLMTYDGRHCLGYEGILCLLIELFDPEASFYLDFERQCVSRKSFKIDSYYSKKEGNNF